MHSSFTQKTWPVCLAVCAVASLAVFVLPLHVPVEFHPAVSASYIAGFNNRAASLAAAAIGGCVLLWAWYRSRGDSPFVDRDVSGDRISLRFSAVVIALTCIFFAVSGWLAAASHLRYLADAGYFIEQMSSHAEYGGALYTQLEFAYGPLLFYPTILLQAAMDCGWMTAYFLTLALDQSVGLALLAYVLNELPIRGRDRRIGFVLLAVGALNPIFGLNYTLLRFITAFAILLFATRAQSLARTMFVLVAGEVLLLGISPEQGFAFLIGTVAFAALQAWRSGAKWLLVAVAPVLGAGVFLLLAGRSYLYMLHSFAKGALSLPVAPYPHLLIFLFAVVWLVPFAIGKSLRVSEPIGVRMAACYALGIGLLPAALGRCDPLHVFFNGAGLLVLSLAAIRSYSRGLRTAWIAALVLLIGWQQRVNNRLLFDRSTDTVRLAIMPHVPERLRESLLSHLPANLASQLRPSPDDADDQLDIAALEQEVGTAVVATPLEVEPSIEAALKRSQHYRPDYYAYGVDMFSAPAEARKIHDMNEAEWALLPTNPDEPFIETPDRLDGVQGFTFPYRAKHPVPFYPGRAFAENLSRNWIAVKTLDAYTLYKRRP
ncbi:MAG TPA: hypothetical protein VFC39_12675 [Acidobacteriaceae bacterium]|nr:hypothetical protein [Acidobacteriaceae bacterium]